METVDLKCQIRNDPVVNTAIDAIAFYSQI